PVLVMKLVKSPVLRLSSENSALEAATAGLRYWKAACILGPAPLAWPAEPWKTSWRPLRVGPLSVLKISSRSASLVVSAVGMTPLAWMVGLPAGPRVRSTYRLGIPHNEG